MSIFSEALRKVIDDTGFTREVWAATAGVNKGSLSKWVTGKNTPTPQHLRLLVSAMKMGMADVPEAIAFIDVLNKPKQNVCPDMVGDEPTLGAYMLRPLTAGVLSLISALSSAKMEKLLFVLSGAARAWYKAPELTLTEAIEKGLESLEHEWSRSISLAAFSSEALKTELIQRGDLEKKTYRFASCPACKTPEGAKCINLRQHPQGHEEGSKQAQIKTMHKERKATDRWAVS